MGGYFPIADGMNSALVEKFGWVELIYVGGDGFTWCRGARTLTVQTASDGSRC